MSNGFIADIRRKQLERVAAVLISERFPRAKVQSERGLVVIADGSRVACLCLRGSQTELTKKKRAEHGRLRQRNIPVYVCRSDSEVQFALDAVRTIKKATLS